MFRLITILSLSSIVLPIADERVGGGSADTVPEAVVAGHRKSFIPVAPIGKSNWDSTFCGLIQGDSIRIDLTPGRVGAYSFPDGKGLWSVRAQDAKVLGENIYTLVDNSLKVINAQGKLIDSFKVISKGISWISIDQNARFLIGTKSKSFNDAGKEAFLFNLKTKRLLKLPFKVDEGSESLPVVTSWSESGAIVLQGTGILGLYNGYMVEGNYIKSLPTMIDEINVFVCDLLPRDSSILLLYKGMNGCSSFIVNAMSGNTLFRQPSQSAIGFVKNQRADGVYVFGFRDKQWNVYRL